MEAKVFKVVGSRLAARKVQVHSAIAEDGTLPPSVYGPGASVGPWRSFQRALRHHADVEWRMTARNVLTCLLIAKFGAHGPQEAKTIVCCAIGLVVWQMRAVRYAVKILLSLASEFRGGYLVDLLSTLLPTSHRALLEAEMAAEEVAYAQRSFEEVAAAMGRRL